MTGLAGAKLDRYLCGDCVLLALAIHERTGWPAMQIAMADEFGEHGHVLVQMPDGRMLDAAGPHGPSGDEEPFDPARWLVTVRASGGGRKPWRSPKVRADADELLKGLP